jgi:nucleolar protein 15
VVSNDADEIQTQVTGKPRKRAVDFLGDEEGKGGKAAVKNSDVSRGAHSEKPKKKKAKKDKAALNGDVDGTVVQVDQSSNTAPDASEASSHVPAAPKPSKVKAGSEPQEVSAATDQPATSVPKKKGPSVVNVHAEKIKKLLGQKDQLPKQSKTAKEDVDVQAAGFTADGANGMANDATSTSMQAEAQRTTEKELEDEFDSGDEVDQAGALLKGFDSDTEDPAEDEGFDKTKPTAALPNYKKTQKKLRQAAQKGNKDGPGAVYVGRIPHGFYENEMRQYFSQFGIITKLRLSRNRKTGRSKHFAFLEFESHEVAKIVAETMDNYLMYGHILKCKYVQPEALHPDTFKGANKRFRVAPHNRMEKRALEAPKTESQWAKKNVKEQTKREKKAEKLKAIGYDIDLPKLKSPSEVLQRKQLQRVGEGQGLDSSKVDEKEVPAPNAVPKDEVAVSKKKSKKERKEKTAADETSEATVPTADSNVLTSNPTQAQNVIDQKSENRDKRKQKRDKAKNEPQLVAQLMADGVLPKATEEVQAQPTEATVAPTTTPFEPTKASKSSKEKKKKDKSGAAHSAAEETSAQVTTKPPVAATEKDARPSTTSAERVKDDMSKKKSTKRKSSSEGDELAGSESKSTEAVATMKKRQKDDGEPTTKSILKRLKKA